MFAESKEAFSFLLLRLDSASLTQLLLLYLCDSYPLTAYFHSESSQEPYFCLCDDKIVEQDLDQVWSLSVTVATIPEGLRGGEGGGTMGPQEGTLKCQVGKIQKLELRQKSCCD